MKKFLKFLVLVLVLVPTVANAASIGEKQYFYIDDNYDTQGRDLIPSTLKSKSIRSYFYIEDEWWNGKSDSERNQIIDRLDDLGSEFDSHIYEELRNFYGSEWRLGIDGNRRITVLVQDMKGSTGGYIRTNDEYFRSRVDNSNEREMVYLDTDSVASNLAPSYLAHEFTHLITFNQKNHERDVNEETWLNEVRSEYAPTYLGYDDDYRGSNLETRVATFLSSPSDSITEWNAKREDYGALNLFTQYLAGRYGEDVLVDSLQSRKVGIDSFDIDFGETFSDWLVASYINDCSVDEKYCYANEDLSGIKVSPQVNFLPLDGSSSLGVSQRAKNWAGNWFKFVGGKKGALKIEFIGNPNNVFDIPYLVRDFSGNYSVGHFELNEKQRGKIIVSGFGTEVSSVVIMPSVQTQLVNPDGEDVPFFFEATTITEKDDLENGSSNYLQRPIDNMGRGEVLSKISELQQIISQLQARLATLEEDVAGEVTVSCDSFSQMRVGARGKEVECLQSFLKKEEVYPEGLVTGYFGPLTKQAVIRFQEKYSEDVLSSWDLTKGTGFVGPTTLKKINFLIGG